MKSQEGVSLKFQLKSPRWSRPDHYELRWNPEGWEFVFEAWQPEKECRFYLPHPPSTNGAGGARVRVTA